MHTTAKLFITGRSQALRLPKEFRFSGTEVFIRRDPVTGEVILSPKPISWAEFFELADSTKIPAEFMADREDQPNHRGQRSANDLRVCGRDRGAGRDEGL